MSFYVRKIEKGKWLKKDLPEQEGPSADAITNCIRTKNNKLSLWEINDDDDNDIENAVIAIAAAGDHLDTFDIVRFNEIALSEKGLSTETNPGKTSYKCMVSNHRDIVNLDYKKLGKVSEIIMDEITNNRDKRFTFPKIKELLLNAISEGKINQDELSPFILEKLIT